jgi:nitronate monooxygenase
MRSFRNNHRVLANDSTAAVLELERAGVTDFAAYAPHVAGTVTRDAYRSGDLSRGMIDYGQAVAFVDSVETTEAIFDTLLDDAVAARRRLEAVSLG